MLSVMPASGKNIAIIPARGGSKGIPHKNLQVLAGRPLVAHSIEHALNARSISRVFVSTDDAEIAAVSRACGAEVIERPRAISGDLASSESAIQHALDFLRVTEGYVPDLVAFLQATSPLRPPEAIDEAVATLHREGADSLFSACPQHSFLWKRGNNGSSEHELAPVNYDYRHRQMRQEGPEYFAENGSIYVFRPWVLAGTGARLGGKITIYPMDYLYSLQIDAPEELDLAARLLPMITPKNARQPERVNVAGKKPSAAPVEIAGRRIACGEPSFVIAEIGINHNGDLGLAKKLIAAASLAGCDAVKFQKRTVDAVYSLEELARPRENPFGDTNGDLKRGLEFGLEEYRSLDAYCRDLGILWFASSWDPASVDFIEQFNPPCHKIASAMLTDDDLLRHHRRYGRPLILSTGMSTLAEIDHAVDVLGREDLILMHTTSTYPCKAEELNLSVLDVLRHRYGVPVGYSGHEVGLQTSVAAVALGACAVERHITLDRSMWGSDQSASVEPQGFMRLVRDIRAVECAIGDGVKRVYESEVPVLAKLRRVPGFLQQASV